MIVVPLIIHAVGNAGEIGNGDIAKSGFPSPGNIGARVYPIPDFTRVKMLSGWSVKNRCLAAGKEQLALDPEDLFRQLPGRAGDKVSFQLCQNKRIMKGQRMVRGTDAGQRSRTKLPVFQGRLFLLIFYAERSLKLVIFHQA